MPAMAAAREGSLAMSSNITFRLGSDLRALEREHQELLADLDEIQAAAAAETLTADELRRLMTLLINMNRRALDLSAPLIEVARRGRAKGAPTGDDISG